MNTFKTICNSCLVILSAIAFIVSLAFVYVHFFVKDITIGVNNIGDQIALDIVKADDLTEEEKDIYEERWFMHANYYSNAKNNGIEIQELQYNYFMTWNLEQADYRSTGMQFLGDFDAYTTEVANKEEADNYVLDEFCYYDSVNGITYNGYNGEYGSLATILNRNSQFIIKLDNKPYSIQLTGLKHHYGKFLWFDVHVGTTYYDYGDVFDTVFKAIKTNNEGYGDYYINIPLSEYFTVFGFDEKSGKFKEDNIVDIVENYSVLKVHYDENGLVNSSQSLFGMVDGDRNYGSSNGNLDTSYWQEKVVYTLNENYFDLRYSELFKGNLVSLKDSVRTELNKLDRTKINVVIDITNENNIVGLDYNSFQNFKLNTLTITGLAREFSILDKALLDTEIKTIKHSNDITLTFYGNACNSEYVEVIL